MELRHIRSFLAIADEGGFTRAAESLGIGQPPLSQQMKVLEAEIGAPLFHRTPRGAELTEAGHALMAVLRPIPELVAQGVLAARRAARGESGSLTLGFTGLAALNPLVPRAIRRFQQAYPQVEITLEEGPSVALLEGLAEGRVDAAIIRPPRKDPEGVRVYRLLEEPLIVAMSSDQAQALGRSPFDLAALRDLPLITMRGGLQDAALAACRHAGFEPLPGPEAPQIPTVLSLVAAALGFALVPATTRQLAMAGVSFADLPTSRTIGLALAHQRDARSVALRHFIAEVRAEAAPDE